MKALPVIAAALILALSCKGTRPEVVVYGGTASGVVAARSAALSGCNVTLIAPEGRLGGMTSGGLGYTDIGNKQVVGGLAKYFYRQTGSHYGSLESWVFEPHVAEAIMEDMARHPNIRVLRGMSLTKVDTLGGRILSITVRGGSLSQTIAAKAFIDCSYEGDLMAAAGVSYVTGREDNSVYGEIWNGQQMLHGHQFPDGIDPFLIEDSPGSGLLPGLTYMEVNPGKGDSLIQAYNFRICLTDSLPNQVPISKPAGYAPGRYELLRRLMRASPEKTSLNDWLIWNSMPGRKTDINNRGGFSTDVIGMSQGWPEADKDGREAIFRAHKQYTEGLLYFLGHDEAVPKAVRDEMLRWGWCKDEFGGGLSPQLYVRECRRMVGEYVCTQADCEGRNDPPDAVAMAAYTMDSHNCRRGVILKDGKYMVKNEGNVEVPGGGPYPIPYRAITPKRAECTNLLVPVCLSASHIAYGSIRMEPVFMVLGQVAGMAAAYCSRHGLPVQDADAGYLRKTMEEDPCLDGSAPDVIIDDDSPLVEVPSDWIREKGSSGYGPTFLRSVPGDNSGKVIYHIPDNLKGEYAVYAYQQKVWSNPLVTWTFSGHECSGTTSISVNLESLAIAGQTSGEWIPLGTFRPGRGATIEVSFGPSADLPCKSDALLLLPKHTETE